MTRSPENVHVCGCEQCREHPRSKAAREHRLVNRLLARLDEKSARLFVGLLATREGRGGITHLSVITGMSRVTILKGAKEMLSGEDEYPGQIRKPGAGRLPKEMKDPDLKREFDRILEEETGGAPTGPTKWIRVSTRNLAERLSHDGHTVSHSTVGRWLRREGYKLRSNRKRLAASSLDRNRQFGMIKRARARFHAEHNPIISVDAKKRELIGNHKNPGKEWRQRPRDVNVYDFPGKKTPIAIPYGVYDVEKDEGFIVVGTSKNTPQFSVSAVRTWWRERGRHAYPDARRLLILADAGGSNGARAGLWRQELKRFSDQTGLEIHVAHYPTGASKWNPVEHRLFSFVAINWQAKPITDYSTLRRLIRGTKTRTGLRCHVRIDARNWPTGVRASGHIQGIKRSKVLPLWNYVLKPVTPRGKPSKPI